MEPVLDFRNTNSIWSSVLVETLFRRGVRLAVVSPGSRSAPLAMALAAHPGIEAVSVLDERSAGFFALGSSKRTHVPAVVLCTSGTAGANLLPAVVEAHESNTPLIVITADRPPEMRDCSSGQTIDQQKLFGGYVGFFHELSVPEARPDLLRYLRQTTAHACSRALRPQAGPVHLNAPFRDPLPPIEDGTAEPLRSAIGVDFFSHLEAAELPNQVGSSLPQGPATTRGVIIAGPASPIDDAAYVAAVREFAAQTGWPVLADALSPVRHAGAFQVPVVGAYDAVLRNERLARDLIPDCVVCLGGLPTSKVLRGWLDQSEAEMVLVTDTQHNRDAVHGKTRILPIAAEGLRPRRSGAASAAADALTEYAARWRAAEDAASAYIATELAQTAHLFEAKTAWELARCLPKGSPVFVASSMPVRDVEYFWPVNDHGFRFYFNRGANGIDGTLSTALGVAHGGAPAVLLTGDLALLHDGNGFLSAAKLRGSLSVVLINNNGGGIFEHLPIAGFDPPFEELFATPQNVDFAALCAAHGFEHTEVTDWPQFDAVVSKPPRDGLRVIELKTDRKRDAVARKRLLDDAGAAAGSR